MTPRPGRARGGDRAAAGILGTALGFAIVGVLLVGKAAGRIGVVTEGLELSRLQAEEQALSQENGRLKLEVLTLRSPNRLEKLARETLGMAAPDPAAILRPDAPARPPRARRVATLAERP